MNSPRLFNHLLTCRKRSALSQEEVAYLLGVETGQLVCRHERFTREPTLQTALAYEAIYQKPISQLFPDLFAHAKREVKARAEQLRQKPIHGIPSPFANRKRQTISALASLELTP